MSDSPKKPSARRGFKVGGQTQEDAIPERAKVRSLDDVFGLDREGSEETEGEGSSELKSPYPEHRLRQFLEGRITLGDLEGITKQEQYQMAELGHSYVTSGKLDQARVVYEGLLALDPFDAYFNMALASIAQQQDRFDDAEKGYSRALEINPFSPSAHAHRGETRVQLGRLEEGARDLIRAVELDPGGKEPASVRARATLLVLREQLTEMSDPALRAKAEESTDARVRAAGGTDARAKAAGHTPPTRGADEFDRTATGSRVPAAGGSDAFVRTQGTDPRAAAVRDDTYVRGAQTDSKAAAAAPRGTDPRARPQPKTSQAAPRPASSKPSGEAKPRAAAPKPRGARPAPHDAARASGPRRSGRPTPRKPR